MFALSFGFNFVEDSGSKNNNEQIKQAINIMESDFTQANFNYIKQVFEVLTATSSNLNELKMSNNFMNSYKAYLAKSIFESIRSVLENWKEKSKYYETVKTDIDVEFDELMQMMREFHESNSLDRRSKAIFIGLIKEKSENINNTVENAIKDLESLKQRYENQGNEAILSLAINAIGLYYSLTNFVIHKVVLVLNVVSALFNSLALFDSRVSINEINEQISLVESKLIEIEKAIEQLSPIESKQ